MANDRDVMLRIRAYHLSCPVLRLQHRPVPVVNGRNHLTVAFVRMGGESSPWAMGWRSGRASTEFRSVPEARNRTAVAEMVAEFGDTLAAHLERGKHELCQVWVPGPSHLEMLHFLSLRYSKARKADPGLVPRLNRLGRHCGHLFRQAENPNDVSCLDATEVLRRLYVFPCEPIREIHLGYLLALLGPEHWPERQTKARAAERLSISTSMDPGLERQLSPVVEAWNDADSDAAKLSEATKIANALQPEIERRLDLLEEAIEAIELSASANPGVAHLEAASLKSLDEHHQTEAYIADGNAGPDPETDHAPTTAAANYAFREADEVAASAALIPFDSDLQDELVAAGSAFRGKVMRSEMVPTGPRAKRHELTVSTDALSVLRLRKGDKVCLAGATDADPWKIIEVIDDALAGTRDIVLRAEKSKPKGPVPTVGEADLVFHEQYLADFRKQLAWKIRETRRMADDGTAPGGWVLDDLRQWDGPDSAAEGEQLDGTAVRIDDVD